MLYLHWGKVVREYRLRNGLSQCDLAEIVGADQQSVSKWERKGMVPEAVQTTMKRLLHAEDRTLFVIMTSITSTTQVRFLRRGPNMIACSPNFLKQQGGRIRPGNDIPDFVYQYSLATEAYIEERAGPLYSGDIAAVRIRRPWFNLLRNVQEEATLLYEPMRLFDGLWAVAVTSSTEREDIDATPTEPVVITTHELMTGERRDRTQRGHPATVADRSRAHAI